MKKRNPLDFIEKPLPSSPVFASLLSVFLENLSKNCSVFIKNRLVLSKTRSPLHRFLWVFIVSFFRKPLGFI
jgi:hypothetical protein